MRLNRLITLLLIIANGLLLPAANEPPPTIATSQVEAELSAVFAQRLESDTTLQALPSDLFTPEVDTAFISPDGQTAVIWVALRDKTGRILGTEPGLALATRMDSGWQVLLPGDSSWDQMMAALPVGMLPAEQSPMRETASISPNADLEALTGYYLPWVAGTFHWLEGSIIHFQPIYKWGYPSCTIDDCRYAYDFTDYGHFPLVASKDGTVYASSDACSDGVETCTNYIVLSSNGSAPFQIYLHLSHGTIPDKLTPGTVVQRGQYLGDTDDTGYSTSNHVHFMVTNNLIWSNKGYYWGNSVDIRFADVAINNGIPRTCFEVINFNIYDGATQCTGNLSDPTALEKNLYTSGNAGQYPATGTISRPEPNKTVASGSNPLMDATAIAIDDVQVEKLRFVAKINNQWVEIGPSVTQLDFIGNNTYDWDVNLCAAGPLNGWLEVGLRIWDHEGNVSGPLDTRMIYVDGACPGQLYLPLVSR